MSAKTPGMAIGEVMSTSWGRGRYEPDHPEHHAQPTETLAKGRGREHGHLEGDETYRQEEEPHGEQRIEYALGRLPQEDERRLIFWVAPGA